MEDCRMRIARFSASQPARRLGTKVRDGPCLSGAGHGATALESTGVAGGGAGGGAGAGAAWTVVSGFCGRVSCDAVPEVADVSAPAWMRRQSALWSRVQGLRGAVPGRNSTIIGVGQSRRAKPPENGSIHAL